MEGKKLHRGATERKKLHSDSVVASRGENGRGKDADVKKRVVLQVSYLRKAREKTETER